MYRVHENFVDHERREITRAVGTINSKDDLINLAAILLRKRPNAEIVAIESFGLTTRINKDNIEDFTNGVCK